MPEKSHLLLDGSLENHFGKREVQMVAFSLITSECTECLSAARVQARSRFPGELLFFLQMQRERLRFSQEPNWITPTSSQKEIICKSLAPRPATNRCSFPPSCALFSALFLSLASKVWKSFQSCNETHWHLDKNKASLCPWAINTVYSPLVCFTGPCGVNGE